MSADAARLSLVRASALHALDRAEALLGIAEARGMTGARVHPAMWDVLEQIGCVAGFAERAVLPMAGLPRPEGDLPATPEAARARLAEARAGVLAAEGAPPGPIAHRAGEAELAQEPEDYAARFALPNLWFHLSVAYAALRAAGAPVGKADLDGLHAYPPEAGGGPRPVPGWRARPLPPRTPIRGLWCTLEPLGAEHAAGLWSAFEGHPEVWRWMPVGPFADAGAYAAWVDGAQGSHDPMHFAVIGEDGAPGGTLSLMRMDPANGTAEIGFVAFAPLLQRTRAASEAVILLARAVFGLGYRRLEWKCDAGNAPSMRAARRYGFAHEGTFRQAAVVKGRNRDTAWFSILDGEAPAREAAWSAWLDPSNFDASGRQISAMHAAAVR